MKVLVISDTHGVLLPETEAAVSRADAVIHAGDFETEENFNSIKVALKPGAPFFAVRGNNDRRFDLPEEMSFELGGYKFLLKHNRKGLSPDSDVNFVIFGHTHRFYRKTIDGKLWLNPGSCGKNRLNRPSTMAEIDISTSGYTVKPIYISVGGANMQSSKIPKDPQKSIGEIIKRCQKGESADKISEKLGIDGEFTEQVIRMYTTHPGIDAGGILDRIVGSLRKR